MASIKTPAFFALKRQYFHMFGKSRYRNLVFGRISTSPVTALIRSYGAIRSLSDNISVVLTFAALSLPFKFYSGLARTGRYYPKRPSRRSKYGGCLFALPCRRSYDFGPVLYRGRFILNFSLSDYSFCSSEVVVVLLFRTFWRVQMHNAEINLCVGE